MTAFYHLPEAESIRAFYEPLKSAFTGVTETNLPEKMDRFNIALYRFADRYIKQQFDNGLLEKFNRRAQTKEPFAEIVERTIPLRAIR